MSKAIYKGKRIKIDLTENRYMRELDRNWNSLHSPKFIALTQVKMKQSGGGRGARINHSTKAFCTYIKAGDLNILAYRGTRKVAEKEAQNLAKVLGVEVKDMIPRNPDGSIDDDDQWLEPENIQGCFVIVILVVVALSILGLLFS